VKNYVGVIFGIKKQIELLGNTLDVATKVHTSARI